ncbi:MAG: hypothetical protein LBE47_02280 [Methanomassiliicoccaceae archaeon]|jgi:hypothetical protein|nr:hypothetical protein [Methanomassiliicoccaceae archaeon]
MEFSDIIDALMSNHIPTVTLMIGGILAIAIACLYMKDRRSERYKPLMVIGTVFGVFMAIIAFNTYGMTGMAMSTSLIMVVAAFTLIIRPFKEVHFAALIALMVIGVVYVLLGGLADTQLSILSEGWWRIGISVVCGALVYSLLHMLESVVKMAGKVMNAWPILFVLGAVCILEATMVFMGYGSTYEFIRS